jgi:regulation of enolase protein 1 (concanavalin A-like superfamily)
MESIILDEKFTANAVDSRLEWTHLPERWRVDPAKRVLVVEPAAGTDFWQRTHYGFRVDNGHFLGLQVAGDFAVSTQVAFHPVHQYDQAGLMIRLDADCWIKTSVEHELEGRPQLGVVVTNYGFSDWSLQDLPLGAQEIRLRLRRTDGDVTAEFSAADGEGWKMMRVAHLHTPGNPPLRAGLYACSPKGAGFRAEFTFLRVAAIERTAG